MTSTIKIHPLTVTPSGDYAHFGDETGTPEFYVVKETLQKFLGDHILVSWDYNEFFFILTDLDEGCDNTNDYIQIIKAIHEPGIYNGHRNNHLVFRIIND